MAECTHNCSSCGESGCGERTKQDLRAYLSEGSSVKKVYGVVSGKGGVGKSMVTSLLACAASDMGLKTAILDADITGPSIPTAFGVRDKAYAENNLLIPQKSKGGIDIMSINLCLDDESQPVIWRGPVVAGAIKQFWEETLWKDEDVMFIDMPPGTSDVPLTVFQSIPLDGIIIVTSPQNLVTMVVEKAINMANMMNVPIIGIVENMSYIVCPCCGEHIKPFGESDLGLLAKIHNIPFLAGMPIDNALAEAVDMGEIEDVDNPLRSFAELFLGK